MGINDEGRPDAERQFQKARDSPSLLLSPHFLDASEAGSGKGGKGTGKRGGEVRGKG